MPPFLRNVSASAGFWVVAKLGYSVRSRSTTDRLAAWR